MCCYYSPPWELRTFNSPVCVCVCLTVMILEILPLCGYFNSLEILIHRLFSDTSTLSNNPRRSLDIGFLSVKLIIMISLRSPNSIHCEHINSKHTPRGNWPVALTHTPRNGRNPGTNKANQYRPSISPPGNCLRNGIEIMRFSWGTAVASLKATFSFLSYAAANVHTRLHVYVQMFMYLSFACAG